ncbi:hypothetical protein CSUI_000042 [Cystoisospora suis]|uniref:Uncharacterized protein n=1 Tax=Cystoisospora suis TaxID=483139 RepID=A0A2C6LIR0_9APIC|nr:hypothetical protein CSUI_000042 [Cystoisospora suis]
MLPFGVKLHVVIKGMQKVTRTLTFLFPRACTHAHGDGAAPHIGTPSLPCRLSGGAAATQYMLPALFLCWAGFQLVRLVPPSLQRRCSSCSTLRETAVSEDCCAPVTRGPRADNTEHNHDKTQGPQNASRAAVF